HFQQQPGNVAFNSHVAAETLHLTTPASALPHAFLTLLCVTPPDHHSFAAFHYRLSACSTDTLSGPGDKRNAACKTDAHYLAPTFTRPPGLARPRIESPLSAVMTDPVIKPDCSAEASSVKIPV